MSFNSCEVPSSLYLLVDEQAGGILAPWVKYSRSSGDYSILGEYLDTAVKSYLYNGGKGKLVSISVLVKRRNKERNAQLGALRRKKGRGKSGPNILDDISQDRLDASDFLKALKILDGASARGQKVFKYRELVWDVEQRGKMGENLLHICLLHNTADMNELAKQIVIRFPKIVNDIFISEDYYGLSPVHQAIVNEDVEMVYFLCKKGADVHQRCYGSFFCADDQKASRTDSLEHEWVDLVQNTRYTGQMYWGELPLSFAACTNNQDCFRLLRAFRADPNMTDTNGNTVLHMTVIHDLPEMFMLAYNSGASLSARNNLKLTPLALAARLANKRMFSLILECEMDIVWRYGDIVCKAYPLLEIDSVREEDGGLNPCSVLANVVYGDKRSHLDFFDGLIEELLERKWEAFAKKRWAVS
uniref:ANK_REP_REGION domain-containing protein n=1 Tax=Angiostrongylus cantonensis TaxID=6313 RepID=A0A158P911_ANGCA